MVGEFDSNAILDRSEFVSVKFYNKKKEIEWYSKTSIMMPK